MPIERHYTQSGLVPAVAGGIKRMPIRLAPNLTIAKGMAMVDPFGSGIFVPYVLGSNGKPTCLLEYQCLTDAAGNAWYQEAFGVYYQPSPIVNAFWGGIFQCADIPNLDAAAVSSMGRLVLGTVSSGLLLIC